MEPEYEIPFADHDDDCVHGEQQYLDLTTIVQLLQGALLLPCERGVKGCRDKGWQQYESNVMQDPDYLRRLEVAGGIAVLLGKKSDGICTIDVDSDDDVGEMLKLNPRLTETLFTKGERGGNFWIRIRGEYPVLTPLDRESGGHFGEWRADGGQTVLCGVHPSGRYYQAPKIAAPIVMEFKEIKWPPGVVGPQLSCTAPSEDDVHEQLVEKYGEPLYFANDSNGGKKVNALNEAYYAAKYSAENPIVFCKDEQKFYHYDGDSGLFHPHSPDLIKQKISSDILGHSRMHAHFGLAAKMRTDRVLTSIVSQLRGIAQAADFKMKPVQIVHLRNCVLEVGPEGVRESEFSPVYLSRNASEVSFDREARCDRFLNELIGPALGTEDRALLQMVFGQCLLGTNLLQKFLILTGPGGRGKSQLADVIQRVVGFQNVTQLRTAHLNERFELYRYLGRTLLVGNDVEHDFLMAKGASVLKSLVGGDRFDAEQKGGTGSFQIEGKFNILITANNNLKLRMQGDLEAWQRRLLIIPVEGPRPQKPIPNFGELLIKEEGPGIVNWAIEGLQRLLDDIRHHGGVRLTSAQSSHVTRLLAESDSVRHFLNDCVRPLDGGSISVQGLTAAYSRYCADKGWNTLPEHSILRQFKDLMLEIFKTPQSHNCSFHGKTARGYRGVVLTECVGIQ